MDQPLPLSALLSHVLVAFTIEFDNEAEQQLEHRTTPHGSTHFRKSLRQVLTQLDVELPNCLPILKYGLFSRGSESEGPAPPKRRHQNRSSLSLPTALSKADPAGSRVIARLTGKGRLAQDMYHRRLEAVEQRWRSCFGALGKAA